MGRWKKGKRQNKDQKGSEKRPKLEGNQGTWTRIVKENKFFEECYKVQGIVSESEWSQFMEILKTDLPSTFRITGSKSDAKDLSSRFRDLITKMENDDDTEIRTNAPYPLKWYPDELAWETKAAKKTLRKSPLYQDFHNFLVEETNCGGINRQEAVSMIPPLLLNVKSSHKVLDMCAAPGSKTTQLIEMLHDGVTNGMPPGLLIANDVDNKRCYMLVHQSNRLKTPSCIVTNHDARVFPSLRTKEKSSGDISPLRFDRILCDVPCSGDGTIRKNPLLWSRWKPGLGNPLHRLQLQILKRGLELLEIGGRLVYSTCSMNPVENEAVVAAALRKCAGSAQLLDVSQELPNLKRRQGLYTWKVFSRSGKEAELPNSDFKESMFPPTQEEAEHFQLEKCLRIYPHLQDTGGFFIAVFGKTHSLPWQKGVPANKQAPQEEKTEEEIPMEPESIQELNDAVDEKQDVDIADSMPPSAEAVTHSDDKTNPATKNDNKGKQNGKRRGKGEFSGFKEDPYIFLSSADEDVQKIRNHYRMNTSFPDDQILVRTEEGKRRHLYIVSKRVKDLVEMNRGKLKVINTGVRTFSRLGLQVSKESGCDYRLTQEGLHVTRNFISSRIIEITAKDLELLLTEEEPFVTKLSTGTQEQLTNFSAGCVVWRYCPDISSAEPTTVNIASTLWLCGHKGKSSVRCMLPKEEKFHYRRLLGLQKTTNNESKADSTERVDDERTQNETSADNIDISSSHPKQDVSDDVESKIQNHNDVIEA